MKRKSLISLTLLFVALCSFFCGINTVKAYADDSKTVLLGGMPAGFNIETRGAFVAGLTDVITKDGVKSPSKDAGLNAGDIIYFINDIEVNNAKDIESALKTAPKTVELDIYRCGNSFTIYIEPAIDLSGDKKLGVFIRDNVSGIGTVTFIDGNKIATLGHPVMGEDEKLLSIKQGKIFGCNITGYVKGERGTPGELRGVILKNNEIATIDRNTECGIYGTLTSGFDSKKLNKIEIGEGKMGDAFIYTTINGTAPEKYSISIVKAENVLSDTKNYVIKITDKRLLDTTGGIVQGMSGSPIVQDGKLVGAVTHVFISDPTRGFGISINNMLNK